MSDKIAGISIENLRENTETVTGYYDFGNIPDIIKFYHGYTRYGQFGKHAHVIVCCLHDRDELRDAVEALDGGDDEALDSADVVQDYIDKGIAFLGHHDDPVIAMQMALVKFLKGAKHEGD